MKRRFMAWCRGSCNSLRVTRSASDAVDAGVEDIDFGINLMMSGDSVAVYLNSGRKGDLNHLLLGEYSRADLVRMTAEARR